jgi:hypothetical protein
MDTNTHTCHVMQNQVGERVYLLKPSSCLLEIPFSELIFNCKCSRIVVNYFPYFPHLITTATQYNKFRASSHSFKGESRTHRTRKLWSLLNTTPVRSPSKVSSISSTTRRPRRLSSANSIYMSSSPYLSYFWCYVDRIDVGYAKLQGIEKITV